METGQRPRAGCVGENLGNNQGLLVYLVQCGDHLLKVLRILTKTIHFPFPLTPMIYKNSEGAAMGYLGKSHLELRS